MSETTMLLRLAASLPCDPRHRATLSKAADEIEQLQATNQQLLEAMKNVQDDLLRRADIDDDGTRAVNLSHSVWDQFCDAIEQAIANAKQQEVN